MDLKARAEQLFGLGAAAWPKRYWVGALVCALIAMMEPLGTTPAAAAEPPDYVVAEVPFPSNWWTAGPGGAGFFTPSQVEGLLCDTDLQPNCSDPGQFPLTFFFDALSPGTTIWFDATNPNFAAFVGAVTDGIPECVQAEFEVAMGLGSTCTIEPFFFGDQVGPNGVDLGGFAIHRVGIRIDTFSFTHPDPTTTAFQTTGALLFEGSIAVKEECKDGGWQNLHRGDGTGFRNQGDCIQFFNTGK